METILRAGLGNAASAALLAFAAAGAGCLLGRRPALRHALWLLVLVKLITPPLRVVPIAPVPLASPGEPVALSSPVEGPSLPFEGAEPAIGVPGTSLVEAEPDLEAFGTPDDEAPAASPRERASRPVGPPWPSWRGLVAAAWPVGTLVTLGVAAVRIRRWNRVMRAAQPAQAGLCALVDELARAIGLARSPSVWWIPADVSPMVWAFGCRARLILPRGLWERLDDRQRTTLLVHELAHLRRRDHWVRLVELLATSLYWWFPLVWLARRALREAEEQCCDAWVVWACPGSTRRYAETLLETVDFLSQARAALPMAASPLGPVPHLKRRVIMIMQGTTPRALGWTGLLATLGLSAVLLPMSPTWAQKAEREAPDKPAASGGPDGTPRVADESGPRPKREGDDADARERREGKARDDEKEGGRRDADADAERSAKRNQEERAREQRERAREQRERLAEQMRRAKSRVEEAQVKARADQQKAQEEAERVAKDARVRPDRGRDIDRARADVERARAQLRAAEERLARLSADGADGRSEPRPFRTFGGLREAPRPPAGPREMERFPRGPLGPPASERRLSALEEKLEQLMIEVKRLREDRESSRK